MSDQKPPDLEISQEELDNIRSANTMLNKAEVLNAVDKIFLDAITRLKIRSGADQTIIGALLTVVEADLVKDLKKLKPFVKK